MRFSEPNTNEFEPEQGSVYSERCVGDQHYVCVVNPDQSNSERVRGFPVEIDVEEGEHDAGENILDDGSGYVSTTPPKSDQGSDREQAPKRPRDVADEKVAPGPGDPDDSNDPDGEDSDDPAQRNILELEGTFCLNMRAEGIGSTTVGVTSACKLVGGLQLVDVNKRQKKVVRQLSTNQLQITLSSLGGIEDF